MKLKKIILVVFVVMICIISALLAVALIDFNNADFIGRWKVTNYYVNGENQMISTNINLSNYFLAVFELSENGGGTLYVDNDKDGSFSASEGKELDWEIVSRNFLKQEYEIRINQLYGNPSSSNYSFNVTAIDENGNQYDYQLVRIQ